ncbi:unnamed protein product [Candida verbasci]|uniref:U3 small nucleolar RNA-associated protein 11 n=1 Tax=Candida verbasci TaxID=1227364 RepID=A0A9W4X8H6_9ASCO|nr:unnamed protein product [Candida verbasci]
MTKLVHNIQKKQHRERSQISSRSKYGLLEKKQDYKLRSKDYHKKQAALKALKEKVKSHNPDEYYHGMTRRRTDDKGILISDRGNEVLSVDQVKLLKTQDINYIRTMRMNELKKIEKLQKDKLFESSGKHTIFVDDTTSQDNFNAVEYFNTDDSLINNRENRIKLDQLYNNKGIINDIDVEEKEKLDLQKLKDYKLLQKRIKKEQELKQVESIMNENLEKMKNGNKKKVLNSNGKVHFKWKNQRKR